MHHCNNLKIYKKNRKKNAQKSGIQWRRGGKKVLFRISSENEISFSTEYFWLVVGAAGKKQFYSDLFNLLIKADCELSEVVELKMYFDPGNWSIWCVNCSQSFDNLCDAFKYFFNQWFFYKTKVFYY